MRGLNGEILKQKWRRVFDTYAPRGSTQRFICIVIMPQVLEFLVMLILSYLLSIYLTGFYHNVLNIMATFLIYLLFVGFKIVLQAIYAENHEAFRGWQVEEKKEVAMKNSSKADCKTEKKDTAMELALKESRKSYKEEKLRQSTDG